MCFGRLTTKWKIFRRKLDCSTRKNALIIRVGPKIHNYVINADQLSFSSADVNDIGAFGVQTLPNAFEGNNGYLPIHNTY